MASLATLFLRLFTVVFTLFSLTVSAEDCIRRDYGRTSFVCVCNATYCDTAPSVGALAAGQAVQITSSQSAARFQATNLQFGRTSSNKAVITNEIFIDTSITYQNVLGFGGAFTDAAGINIARLSQAAQDNLMNSYFSSRGIEYGVARVPMAGTDFSTRTYSYDDYPGDVTLSNFALTEEDLVYKIPYINWAISLSSKSIKLFTSPWSAPAWMKSNNEFYGQGYLLGEYYQVWADYFARFFEEYSKFGLNFWALTAQNEPVDGRVPGFPFNCMGWTSENQSIFVGLNLGPTLQAKGFGDVKIMIMDDQRNYLPEWAETVLANPDANPYVSGIGVHWYQNFIAPPSVLTTTHEMFPDRFILATEACEGTFPKETVVLGAWDRLESYATDIIENMNNWAVGWVDWNLALDEGGGPNWSENFVDSPIIVNNTIDEFYKQPMFYAMGHFSKYVPENSIRVNIDILNDTTLIGTAFVLPDGNRAVVILNQSDDDKTIILNDAERGALEIPCEARSMHTILYG